MRRLLILVSALPIIAGLLVAHFMGWRVLNKKKTISLSLAQILEKLKSSELQYTVKKRVWSALPVSKTGEAYITEKHLESKDASIVAAELLKIGLAEIYKTHASMVKWRCKTLKAGYFLPPFIILGGTLAMVVRRIPSGWAVAMFLMVMAGCSITLWLSRGVEKEAAKTINSIIERKRVINRLSEEESIVEAINAWTWIGVLPGILVSLMSKVNQGKE